MYCMHGFKSSMTGQIKMAVFTFEMEKDVFALSTQ